MERGFLLLSVGLEEKEPLASLVRHWVKVLNLRLTFSIVRVKAFKCSKLKWDYEQLIGKGVFNPPFLDRWTIGVGCELGVFRYFFFAAAILSLMSQGCFHGRGLPQFERK